MSPEETRGGYGARREDEAPAVTGGDVDGGWWVGGVVGGGWGSGRWGGRHSAR
jgi:hypothetical protein